MDALHVLDRLHVWDFAPKDKSFRSLVLPASISELQLNWANPKELTGLMPNPNLRRLEIHRCANLETLSALPVLFPSLEHLVVSGCGRLDGKRESSLARHLPSLKHARVQNQSLIQRRRD